MAHAEIAPSPLTLTGLHERFGALPAGQMGTSRRSSAILGEAETLAGGDLLPGLSLPLGDFFAKPRRMR